MTDTEVPLVRAAIRLQLKYKKVMDLVCAGTLKGRLTDDRRWMVDAADCERLRAMLHRNTPGGL